MKKFFTLFVALFAMTFFANAQTFLLQETFDAQELPAGWTTNDSDGDGYDWSFITRDGNGMATSNSFINGFGAVTPDNFLITKAVTLTGAATLIFEAWGQDASYAAEHFQVLISTTGNSVSDFTTVLIPETITTGTVTEYTADLSAYTNQTVYIAIRHFNVTDMFMLNVDNVRIFVNPTEPTIVANPTSLTFGAITFPGTKTMSTTIQAYNLTSGITATATAPFTVSADGSQFGQTATIPQAGGTLYVKYNPSAAGTDNSTITLASGSANASVAVTGSAIDCSGAMALPYFQGFENGITGCETLLDNDGDGRNWMLASEWIAENGYPLDAYEGTEALISESWSDALLEDFTPDNWYITPLIAIPSNGATLSWYVATKLESYPVEKYEVSVAVGGSDNYTSVFSETLDADAAVWSNRSVNLSQFSGQNVKIAFRHFDSNDQYAMMIDNISVSAGVGVEEFNNEARVYPNPATNLVNVEANSAINHIEIFNINGQKINDIQVDGNSTTVNTSNLSNGLYIMKVFTENGVSNQKFSVVK